MDRMKIEGVAPNVHIYNSAISACARCSLWEKGLGLFEEMEKVGVVRDVVSFNAVLDAVCSEVKLGRRLFELGIEKGFYARVSRLGTQWLELDLHFLSLGGGEIALGWWFEECLVPYLVNTSKLEAVKSIDIVTGYGKTRMRGVRHGDDGMRKRVRAMLRFMAIEEVDQPNKGRIHIDKEALIKEVKKNGGRIIFDEESYRKFKEQNTTANHVPDVSQKVRPRFAGPLPVQDNFNDHRRTSFQRGGNDRRSSHQSARRASTNSHYDRRGSTNSQFDGSDNRSSFVNHRGSVVSHRGSVVSHRGSVHEGTYGDGGNGNRRGSYDSSYNRRSSYDNNRNFNNGHNGGQSNQGGNDGSFIGNNSNNRGGYDKPDPESNTNQAPRGVSNQGNEGSRGDPQGQANGRRASYDNGSRPSYDNRGQFGSRRSSDMSDYRGRQGSFDHHQQDNNQNRAPRRSTYHDDPGGSQSSQARPSSGPPYESQNHDHGSHDVQHQRGGYDSHHNHNGDGQYYGSENDRSQSHRDSFDHNQDPRRGSQVNDRRRSQHQGDDRRNHQTSNSYNDRRNGQMDNNSADRRGSHMIDARESGEYRRRSRSREGDRQSHRESVHETDRGRSSMNDRRSSSLGDKRSLEGGGEHPPSKRRGYNIDASRSSFSGRGF